MTFDPWHLAILIDPVYAIMSVSSGEVLSHENGESVAVIAIFIISPQFIPDLC